MRIENECEVIDIPHCVIRVREFEGRVILRSGLGHRFLDPVQCARTAVKVVGQRAVAVIGSGEDLTHTSIGESTGSGVGKWSTAVAVGCRSRSPCLAGSSEGEDYVFAVRFIVDNTGTHTARIIGIDVILAIVIIVSESVGLAEFSLGGFGTVGIDDTVTELAVSK